MSRVTGPTGDLPALASRPYAGAAASRTGRSPGFVVGVIRLLQGNEGRLRVPEQASRDRGRGNIHPLPRI